MIIMINNSCSRMILRHRLRNLIVAKSFGHHMQTPTSNDDTDYLKVLGALDLLPKDLPRKTMINPQTFENEVRCIINCATIFSFPIELHEG